MSDSSYLDWPFFEERHRSLARDAEAWAAAHAESVHGDDLDRDCRSLVQALGTDGWLAHVVAGRAYGGAGETIDTRGICLIRETLARHSGLADFVFAMQGLGSGAISLAGTPAQKERFLAPVASGRAIAAFALSEPDAGSDVGAMACAAVAQGDDYVIDGEKTWISNGGIADQYVVFARTGESGDCGAAGKPTKGSRGITAFIVEASTPGLEVAERIRVIAPHPLARLKFVDCRVPASQRLGAVGEGFKIAMRTLDVFRTSVALSLIHISEPTRPY